MTISYLDISVIIFFLSISMGIGLYYSKKSGKNIKTFFLGGQNLNWYLAGLSMVATTFAADTPLLVTEIVSTKGISGNWLWWSQLMGGMFTTFFFASYWRRAGVTTDLEIIEMRYDGTLAKILRGFKAIYLGIFMNAIIIAWVNLALMALLQVFFNLSYEEALMWTAFCMVFVAFYSAISGFMGVVVSDAVQFFIAMIGCIVLAFFVVNSAEIGGVVALKQKLQALPGVTDFWPNFSDTTTSNGLPVFILAPATFFAFIGLQWWASWYPGAEPGGGGYIAQRMMSCKDEKNAVLATFFFQVAHYCIRPWPWIIVALCSIVLYPELSVMDKKLGYVMAMKDFLPNGFRGLLLAAFLAAYMSTLSTQLNWGSSYVINDLYVRFVNPEASNKKKILFSRLSICVLMLVALFITTQIKTIESAWLFLIECGAGAGLVLMLRWYWWRINVWSEVVATLAPFIGYISVVYLFDLSYPYTFYFTTAFTVICILSSCYLCPDTSHETLDAFYKKIKPIGFWGKYSEGKFEKTKSKFSMNILLVICGTIFTYSTLFFLGKLVLFYFEEALLSLFIAILSGIALKIALNKSLKGGTM